MDFNAVLRDVLPSLAENLTVAMGSGSGQAKNGSAATQFRLAEGLEKLAPLLGGAAQFNPLLRTLMLVNQTVGAYLGIDAAAVVTFLGFIWAVNHVARQVWGVLHGLVLKHLTASVHVSNEDDIHRHVMKWLAAQPHVGRSRALMAETVVMSAWEDDAGGGGDVSVQPRLALGGPSSGRYLNFSNQNANTPPRFVPALGLHNFWFKGTYFMLHRKREQMFDNSPVATSMIREKETMVISCFGWSTEPVKRFLQHAREQYYKDHYSRTVIKRPNTAMIRRYGNRNAWAMVAIRLVRPMDSVVLDADQKRQVLADINEYLHPATPRWYADRGIPLRRGYLFHGPPGTGKTSLSFAIAGIFGLDIYVISLQEPQLTEEDLSSLFSCLPRRCVVLLEDIDTAGLSRPDNVDDYDDDQQDATVQNETGNEVADANADTSAKSPKTTANAAKTPRAKTNESSSDVKVVTDLARALKSRGLLRRRGGGGGGFGGGAGGGALGADGEGKGGISLSGLLNAIDGVASHEGRILIMTTNRPEALDEALIRPGRVDLQVAFSNATQQQAGELFARMYEGGAGAAATARSGASSSVEQALAVADAAKVKSEDLSGRDGAGVGGGAGEKPRAAVDDGRCEHDKDGYDDEAEEEAPGSEELRIIGAEFASRIPGGRFSPAEIQGFLLKRKKQPRKALGDLDGWIAAMLEQKANRSKVIQVQ